MTIRKNQKLLLIIFLIIFSGCTSEYEFNSYENKFGKEKQVFVKDLNFCRQKLNQEKKLNEGSERVGEKLLRKNKLLRICMENENWLLKK